MEPAYRDLKFSNAVYNCSINSLSKIANIKKSQKRKKNTTNKKVTLVIKRA